MTPDDLTLERYIAGDATADERRVVEAWLRTEPSRAEQLASIRAGMVGAPVSFDVARGWQELSPQLARRAPLVPRLVWAAAATAALWLGWSAWGARTLEREAAPGETTIVSLPDGSTVQLAPGALVSWRARAGSERWVRLEGQAWFEVRHATTPFKVYAGRAVIEDVGTRFVVEADTAGDVLVAVEEGEVAIGIPDVVSATTTHLTAGSGARINQEGHITPLRDISDHLAWTQGLLVWRDEPLARVAADLSRWFGERVTVDPGLGERRVTARYSRAAGLPDVLSGIAAALGASVRHDGSAWTMSGASR